MTDMIKSSQKMSDTPEEREFELRAHIGAIWSGGRLFIGIYTFLLAGARLQLLLSSLEQQTGSCGDRIT